MQTFSPREKNSLLLANEPSSVKGLLLAKEPLSAMGLLLVKKPFLGSLEEEPAHCWNPKKRTNE